jgi:hypothetical protein
MASNKLIAALAVGKGVPQELADMGITAEAFSPVRFSVRSRAVIPESLNTDFYATDVA